jgi:hypothetical protein
MSGPELSNRLEPNELRVARAIYSRAAGVHLFVDDGPQRLPHDPRLPSALQLVEPTGYVQRVLDGLWRMSAAK